ncbi:hypothetical protein KUTeg_019070 [Tegillarca granosa]|uniref:5-oxoprolinase n=1 Tax=Tegillarca granosa TaxID=220873 RepID=A0ABQ9EBF9_TEGGR|nr:hypothetical protein KUTeg_019070 [Tegillarca granosa]
MAKSERPKFQFAIDRGGTFTDIWAKCASGKVKVLKLLSVDPQNYPDAPREGIRRIIEEDTGIPIPPNQPLDSHQIEWIRMGTTVATNALLERKGERMALAITKGFRDLLHIGNQARPNIFDLQISTPDQLYEEVIEVEERLIFQQEKCEIKKKCPVVTGTTAEKLEVWERVNRDKLRCDLQMLLDKGIKSLAVVLLHSYTYAVHEQEVGQLAKDMGFHQVSLSSDVMPMVRVVPRGYTASADAYLTPHIKKYVSGFASGFHGGIEKLRVLFMQSDGGLTPVDRFNGSRAILSGPAGGVVGYALTTYHKESDLPVIGFDMGGTSTDVSRYAGQYEHVFETTTAGVTIQAPQLDINTVAAGGGSMLFFRAGMFVVGPESAGADPGPACYKKGGPLTITDANLCLGRLLPDYFPKIFGRTQDQPLDHAATLKAFQKLTLEVNDFLATQQESQTDSMTIEEVAMGFIRVANETMCRPIRALTQAKGHDTSRHVLACFGGAGGQHACAIARSLGMTQVYVHRYAGILSAYGMALADVVHEAQEPCAKTYSKESFNYIDKRIEELNKVCTDELLRQGFNRNQISTQPFLHMRYDRTDCALMVSTETFPANQESSKFGDFVAAFQERYQTEFGFTLPHRPIIVDDIRIRGVGKAFVDTDEVLPASSDTPQVDMIGTGTVQRIGPDLDAIQLSIFSHRFMSIAEQMGRILQRTSISTNIKERLDFSCAMFGPDGGLVANAPHIPVHLGAMQETVQYQIGQLGDTLKDGDVILSNHPQAGGSHLPDLTVITPVFSKQTRRPVFFVASRGHHADIGGITPGSMPPHSKCIQEEGAVFKSFKLVENGVFREEDGFTSMLCDIPYVEQLFLHKYKQSNAEIAVQEMLREIARKTKQKTGKTKLSAVDRMDDGSKIRIDVDINAEKGTAIVDFTGSSYEVYGNCNAPRAVTLSAMIYCLRCMVGHDVPLNQGCLKPVTVIIPKGSILDPSENAAVVGGNVLTSQRIVDVIFKAFGTCAASQGCMNNITFGDCEFGHYETVAGGAGAGPTWDGRSGVHTHMTNTRITDPEILERRYPVILKRFHLNPNTGGKGRHCGGNGIIREYLFRKSLTLSILTERRVFQPYGLDGGENGSSGVNLMYYRDNRIVSLGSKTSVDCQSGVCTCTYCYQLIK